MSGSRIKEQICFCWCCVILNIPWRHYVKGQTFLGIYALGIYAIVLLELHSLWLWQIISLAVSCLSRDSVCPLVCLIFWILYVMHLNAIRAWLTPGFTLKLNRGNMLHLHLQVKWDLIDSIFCCFCFTKRESSML